jgi:hypothetical protein
MSESRPPTPDERRSVARGPLTLSEGQDLPRRSGVCIFCRCTVGKRQNSGLLLKHSIWISGWFETCPGTGTFGQPLSTGAVDPVEGIVEG